MIDLLDYEKSIEGIHRFKLSINKFYNSTT